MSTEEIQSRFVKMVGRDFQRAKSEMGSKYSRDQRDLELAHIGALGILRTYPDEAGAFDLSLQVVKTLREEGISFAYTNTNWPCGDDE